MNQIARVLLIFVAAGVLFVAGTPLAAADRADKPLRWGEILTQDDAFYGTADSIRIAENVLLYQHDNGGWPKNVDMAAPLGERDKARLAATRNQSETIIDNGATWSQIRFLARMHAVTGEARFAESATRGIHYLLDAQYDNGGWPMIYPLRKGYYSHITFNDGAMIGVMKLLRDVARNSSVKVGKPPRRIEPFAFVDAATRARAQQAIDKGLALILATQVKVDGQPTVWCAQYDEHTLAPASARSYELKSLSGYESVGIVRYLMDLDEPSPTVRAAIEAAVGWFERAKIQGERVEFKFDDQSRRPIDRVVVADPHAPPLWARFYTIESNRPMFVSRDGVIHEHLDDLERERRLGYAWLGDWPAKLLAKEYPAWQQRWPAPAAR